MRDSERQWMNVCQMKKESAMSNARDVCLVPVSDQAVV